jgi:hypothetical protein
MSDLIMVVFRAVAAREMQPWEGAWALTAFKRIARWKRVLCWLVGHAEAIELPIVVERKDWPWVCPRCGLLHSCRGSHLPPSWAGHEPPKPPREYVR